MRHASLKVRDFQMTMVGTGQGAIWSPNSQSFSKTRKSNAMAMFTLEDRVFDFFYRRWKEIKGLLDILNATMPQINTSRIATATAAVAKRFYIVRCRLHKCKNEACQQARHTYRTTGTLGLSIG